MLDQWYGVVGKGRQVLDWTRICRLGLCLPEQEPIQHTLPLRRSLPAIGSSIRTDASDDEFLLKETCLALQHSLPRNHSSIIWRKHLRSQLLPKRRRLIIPMVTCATRLGCKVSAKTFFSQPKGLTLDEADFLLARRPIDLRKKPVITFL